MENDTGLPPFSGNEPTCAKCGWDEAGTDYIEAGSCTHPHGAGVNVVVGFTPNPRLHRECTRCSYMWDEASA